MSYCVFIEAFELYLDLKRGEPVPAEEHLKRTAEAVVLVKN